MTFLQRRLTRWTLMLVVLPLTVWAMAEIADQVAAKRGESTLTRVLRLPARLRGQAGTHAAAARG